MGQLKLELSAKTATEFNADYDRLKSQIRDCSNTEREFKTSMVCDSVETTRR